MPMTLTTCRSCGDSRVPDSPYCPKHRGTGRMNPYDYGYSPLHASMLPFHGWLVMDDDREDRAIVATFQTQEEARSTCWRLNAGEIDLEDLA